MERVETKKAHSMYCELKIRGRRDRIRTCDPLVPNQMRYQPAPLSVAEKITKENLDDMQVKNAEKCKILKS